MEQENEKYSKEPGHVTQMATMPVYVKKKIQKLSSPEPQGL